MRRGLARCLLLAVASLAASGRAGAQLSPGPLSAAHAALEGSSHCLECHRAGKGVGPELCLDCHTVLGARIDAGQGLHGSPGHDACDRCHIEHQGRDFELVWWGEQGARAFDHAQIGHPLVGAHATLECRQCHRAERLADAESLRRGGVRLASTYLGLAGGCGSCHRDVHDGELGGGRCESCHDQEQWRPARGFDHQRTGWPLRGRHVAVGCEGCHQGAQSGATAPPPASAGVSLSDARAASTGAGALFVGDTRGTACVACHTDPHAGRLGGACGGCHRETAWTAVDRTSFDHAKTRFPLVGLHLGVECSACHRPGAPAEGGAAVSAPGALSASDRAIAGSPAAAARPFARCETCHADVHRSQFGARADGGDCRACHDESGFAPARFSIEDHDRTAFPLAGAHRAVRCDACHALLDAAAPGEPAVAVPSSATARADAATRAAATAAHAASPDASRARRYRFDSTTCASCHATPHDRASSRYDECAGCHGTGAWTPIRFDHATTRFPLAGVHATLVCETCHDAARIASWRATVAPAGQTPSATAAVSPQAPMTQRPHGGVAVTVPLGGLPVTCAGCHRDVHAGQFDRDGAAAACERCHTPDRWTPAERFDHDRDSRYALAGAHRAAPCAGCHRVESGAGGVVKRYRPLATGCTDCHAAVEPTPEHATRSPDRRAPP